MNQYIRKTTWMSAGLLLAVTCGAPAIADDTELFLLTPADIAARPKPNVLFILDSSGSMDTEEDTVEIYDAAENYSGSCDRDRYYWTSLGVTPTCDASNTQFFTDAAFKCIAGNRRLNAVGSYTNLMAQHRVGTSGFGDAPDDPTLARWQAIAPGNADDAVECLFDRSVDGDGTANLVYAQKGGGVAQFTATEADEVAWGSWPTSQSITVFDGNYLNYKNRVNPPTVRKSRNAILEEVTKVILDAIENVNVGIMHFNQGSTTLRRQGGVVATAMQDLDTNRTALKSDIDDIPHQGSTPLSESLFESALYWRGQEAYYGDDNTWTDGNALASTVGTDVYDAPVSQACAKNFNVLLSDGVPTRDQEVPELLSRLPDWATTVGKTTCTTTAAYDDNDDTDLLPSGACLDEVAEYLSKKDISNQAGVQVVTTHTIGFTETLVSLQEAAAASGGRYFEADDIVTLTNAMLEIFDNVTDQSLSFAAPAVAVNTFNRTQNLNDLYLTTFGVRGSVHWPGNLKKYRLSGGQVVDKNLAAAVNPATGFFKDTATSFWSTVVDGNEVEKGGAVARQDTPANRDIYTNISANTNLTVAANALSTSNAASFGLATLGLTGAADEPSKEDLISWARGVDIRDEDNDMNTTEARSKSMGDPLHSQPAAIVYGGTAASPDVTVYTATNDGFLHAINGTTGDERWAFMPQELLSNLPKLYFDLDSSFKNYGIDGDIVPVVFDANEDGTIDPVAGDFVYIIFGMRRGGGAYYALDVTDYERPQLLWRFDASGVSQSWSTPTIVRIDIANAGQNTQKAVVVIGSGYDTAHDSIRHPATDDSAGAGIYFLDLVSGNTLWRAGRDTPANLTLASMKRAIPTRVSVLDISGDGFADRMYAADMGGQILRFDIFNGKEPGGIGTDALVTGGVIAQLGAEGMTSPAPTDADTRRFYTTPDISLFNDNVQNRRFLAISIGSGYRAHPLDNTTNERFYSVRDKNVFNQLSQNEYNNLTTIKEANLIEVSGSTGLTVGPTKAGWQFTLPTNQKVLSTSVTFNDEIFFVAFSPDTAAAATCSAGLGSNFLYRVKVSNADPVIDLSTIVPGDEDRARRKDLAQGGIAPSPRFLFPSPESGCTGSACSPPPVVCVGVECSSPGFENNPVRTLWTRDGIE